MQVKDGSKRKISLGTHAADLFFRTRLNCFSNLRSSGSVQVLRSRLHVSTVVPGGISILAFLGLRVPEVVEVGVLGDLPAMPDDPEEAEALALPVEAMCTWSVLVGLGSGGGSVLVVLVRL